MEPNSKILKLGWSRWVGEVQNPDFFRNRVRKNQKYTAVYSTFLNLHLRRPLWKFLKKSDFEVRSTLAARRGPESRCSSAPSGRPDLT